MGLSFSELSSTSRLDICINFAFAPKPAAESVNQAGHGYRESQYEDKLAPNRSKLTKPDKVGLC